LTLLNRLHFSVSYPTLTRNLDSLAIEKRQNLPNFIKEVGENIAFYCDNMETSFQPSQLRVSKKNTKTLNHFCLRFLYSLSSIPPNLSHAPKKDIAQVDTSVLNILPEEQSRFVNFLENKIQNILVKYYPQFRDQIVPEPCPPPFPATKTKFQMLPFLRLNPNKGQEMADVMRITEKEIGRSLTSIVGTGDESTCQRYHWVAQATEGDVHGRVYFRQVTGGQFHYWFKAMSHSISDLFWDDYCLPLVKVLCLQTNIKKGMDQDFRETDGLLKCVCDALVKLLINSVLMSQPTHQRSKLGRKWRPKFFKTRG